MYYNIVITYKLVDCNIINSTEYFGGVKLTGLVTTTGRSKQLLVVVMYSGFISQLYTQVHTI